MRRSGGPTGWWLGNARDLANQPNYPLLPSTAGPRQQLGTPQNSAGISSKTSSTRPQRIRAQRHLHLPQYHQTYFSSIQASHSACGHFGLEQSTPPTGLSATMSTPQRRTMPDFMCRVTRPRSERTRIGRRSPIGSIGDPKMRKDVA